MGAIRLLQADAGRFDGAADSLHGPVLANEPLLQMLDHAGVAPTLILAQLADGHAGHLTGAAQDSLRIKGRVGIVLRAPGALWLPAKFYQGCAAMQQAFSAAGQGSRAQITFGEAGRQRQGLIGDLQLIVALQQRALRAQYRDGLLYGGFGHAQHMAVLADGHFAGQAAVPVDIAGRGDEHGIVREKGLLDEGGGARELDFAGPAEEALQMGEEEDAALRPLQPGADGLQVVIQQVSLCDPHETFDARRALAAVNQPPEAGRQGALAHAHRADQHEVAVDGLGDDVEHRAQQFLALMDGGRLDLVRRGASVIIAGGRRRRAQLRQHIRHRPRGDAMRPQQTTGADALVGQLEQGVPAVNTRALPAGRSQRVVDEDDALPREGRAPSLCAEEAEPAAGVAPAGAGQMHLTLQLREVNTAPDFEMGEGAGGEGVSAPQQRQQNQFRHQRGLAVFSLQARRVVEHCVEVAGEQGRVKVGGHGRDAVRTRARAVPV